MTGFFVFIKKLILLPPPLPVERSFPLLVARRLSAIRTEYNLRKNEFRNGNKTTVASPQRRVYNDADCTSYYFYLIFFIVFRRRYGCASGRPRSLGGGRSILFARFLAVSVSTVCKTVLVDTLGRCLANDSNSSRAGRTRRFVSGRVS